MATAAVLDVPVEETEETHEAVEQHEYRPDPEAREFVMVIAREDSNTVDGRRFKENSLTWREPPFPVLFTPINNPLGKENGGHAGARVVASVTEAWRDGKTIYGRGFFGTDEFSQSAADMIDQGLISGVSADVGGVTYEELEADDTEEFGVSRTIALGTIVSVTALPIQAFSEAKISVVASAGSWAPPKAHFENPRLTRPTPLTITDDGRVFGHAATWGTCHIGYKNTCITPPRSNSGYQYFNVGQVYTDDGSMMNVGRLTAGANHALLELGAQPAKEHYDNTGWAAAYVTAGEDDIGIWYSGALSPTATPEQIATLRAGSVSGDWRNIKGALDMVGMLTVNQPGFPIPRAAAGLVAGAQMSLIASGIVTEENADCGCEEAPADAVEFSVDAETEVVEETAAVEAPDAPEVPAEVAVDLTDFLAEIDLEMWDSDEQFGCCEGCSGKKMKKAKKYVFKA